jgi:hypothetical protein
MQNALKVSFGVTKRAFTIAVVVATLAWSVAATFAVAPRVASAATPVAGSLVKGSMSAVYYIGSDNKRYVFTNDKAYKTWYADFSTVQVISDTDLAAITIGGNVTYKPGVKMIKIQSDPKVYAVAHGGVLRWVSTEAAAVALYGSNWNTKIDDISDAFFTNYTVGMPIVSASDFTIANEQNVSPTINADKGLAGGGALNITLASDNPAGATVTRNAQGINLLKVNVTGAGTITGLTFTRLGAGSATDWQNVYLYNGDTRLTSGRSVNSTTQQVAFSNLNIVVSSPMELTLVGDLNALSGIGDANSFSLVAATDVVASATVGGTFPATGNQFSISGSTGGSLIVSAGSTPSAPSMGATGVTLAEFKLAADSKEDLSVRRIVITNAGSGQLSNLANLSIQTNGTVVASSPIVSGSAATFVFAVPYVLGKGITRTFDVVGDIAAGNRATVDSFELYIDQTYDIYATGNTYGAGVAVTDNFTSASAATLTIQGGQITFVSNGPTTGSIPVGANDAVIQKFAITAVNNIEVDNLHMQITASAAIAADIANITDCKVTNSDTGATVTNSYDLASWTNYNDNTFTTTGTPANRYFGKTFTDRFNVNAGQTMNLALTCDISSTPTAALTGQSLTGTVGARADGDIRNLDSNLLVTIASGSIVPVSALIGNPQTISSSGLTVAVASSPTSTTVTRGTTVSALGVNFTAGAASDVKVSQLKLQGFISLDGTTQFGTSVASTGTDTSTHKVQDVVQSVTIWDGTTQVGVAESPDVNGGINFTNLSWNIPAGTTKTLTVSAVLSNNLPYGSATNKFFIDLLGTITTGATGISSNLTAQDNNSNSVSASSAAWGSTAGNRVNLQVVGTGSLTAPVSNGSTTLITAVASGTMQIQVDGDTPVSALVSANTSDNAMTRVSFTTNNEAFNVTRLTIANIGSASSSRSIQSVRVFDGNGTLFCSGALDSSNHLRCSNDAGLFTVNGNMTITIKANIAQVGSGSSATSGDAPKLAVFADQGSASYPDDIKVVGVSSGTALQNAQVNGSSLTFSTTSSGAACGSIVAPAVPLCVGGNSQVIRKVVPTFATIATSTNLFVGQNTLYSFSVTAGANANVAIHKFTLNSSLAAAAVANTFQLYENGSLVDQTKYIIKDNSAGDITGATTITTGAHTIVVTFAGEDKIGLNSTKTFAVKANVTSAPTTSSISTYMLSDVIGDVLTTNTGTGTIAGVDTNTSKNLIWSDNSASLHSAGNHVAGTADSSYSDSSADWTNGFLVQTLPSIPQTLSN